MIYSDNNGLIRLFDGTVVYIDSYQYSSDGITNWESIFQPFDHINPNNPTQTLLGHKYRRVRHSGDINYQYPEYIVATDGKPVILQMNGDVVEWNYEDLSGTWTSLFNMEDYRGSQGEQGSQGQGLYINMYGVGIESTNPLAYDGPVTIDPIYPNGHLPGQRPQCTNGNPIQTGCGTCNPNSQPINYTPFVYMDVNTSITYACASGVWYVLTGLVANNNQVAVSTSPTVSKYLDQYDSDTIVSTSTTIVRPTDSVNYGIQAEHVHSNVVDIDKGLQKANTTTGKLEVKLDTLNSQSLGFNGSGEIEVVTNGIHGENLNSDTVDPLKGIVYNIVDEVLEVNPDEVMIGFNAGGELEIIDDSLIADKIATGEVVKTLNTLTDDVVIVPDDKANGIDINVVVNGQDIELSTEIFPAILFPQIPDNTILGAMLNSDVVANEQGLILDNANLSGTDKIRVKTDGVTIDFNGSGELEFVGDITDAIINTNNVLVKSINVNGTGDLLRDDVELVIQGSNGIHVETKTSELIDTANLILSVDMTYINANVVPVSASVAWGAITGTLSSQTDLTSYVTGITNLKTDRNSIGDTIIDTSTANKRFILTATSGERYSLHVDSLGNLYTTLVS